MVNHVTASIDLDHLADGAIVSAKNCNNIKAALAHLHAAQGHNHTFYFGQIQKTHVAYGIKNGSLDKLWYTSADNFEFSILTNGPERPVGEPDEEGNPTALGDEDEGVVAWMEVSAKAAEFAALVQQIDSECNIVPKGAWRVDGEGYVREPVDQKTNHEDVSNWVHFRQPEGRAAINTSTRGDAHLHARVLDSAHHDQPFHKWSVRKNAAETTIKLRNNKWSGAVAYLEVESGNHGFVYLGNGQCNNDFAFHVPNQV